MTTEKINEQGAKQDPLRKEVGRLETPGAIKEIGTIVELMDPVSAAIMTRKINVSNFHEHDRRAVRSGDVD